MGIVRTDQWLKDNFSRPLKICEKLKPYFSKKSPDEIYNELLHFGMYRPSFGSRNHLNRMLDFKVWDRVELLFNKYKQKWSGPDIPVFLFPLNQRGGLFSWKDDKKKGGVSFADKMFLFLSDHNDEKEIEALLVHEYHHVCRLQKSTKKYEHYTLLDSIIIEGLAEYAVLKHCGDQYLAEWCNRYSEAELNLFWDRFIKDHLTVKKHEKVHDDLLFGGRSVPPLLGYALGYQLVNKFFDNQNYSVIRSFKIPSSQFLDNE
ncbi:DUF2268 domain-containing protein [Neobacillus dielmonensis]|uniref:DUF2268 domain-containing protein n=1 Tax=Neobacillus dielmonensis TaxID=1347369 RepID=UPI0005AA835F|nr:DUF2268 domain-containing protein [Neobacillus dielmonensis]